jgi:replicative DNA helicase
MNRATPSSVDAERGLIGSMLIDDEIASTAIERMSSEDFYDADHRSIFSSINDIVRRGAHADIVSVMDALSKKMPTSGDGWGTVLSDIVSSVPTSIHAPEYMDIIERKAVMRSIISSAHKIAEIGYQDHTELDAAIDKVESIVYGLNRKRRVENAITLDRLIPDTIDRIKFMLEHKGERLGIPSGITSIDRITGGWQESDLIIVAARPSVGKTSLALNMAQHAAIRHGKSVAVFSLEMSKEQLSTRLVAGVSNIDIGRIRRGDIKGIDLARIAASAGSLLDAKIVIDDTPVATPSELRGRCRRIESEHGLDLIVVDYLQLMTADRTTKDANRVSETSDISRGLKRLAREMGVPVIALSQLSRSSEHREGGQPRLSDLRDSGAIEQDADVVLMLWRQGQQDPLVEYEDVNAIIAKHRNGPTGMVELTFHKPTTTFHDKGGHRV